MIGEVEHDDAIEHLIQLELNALHENDLDSEEESEDLGMEEEKEEEGFDQSMSEYLSIIQTYNEEAAQRMDEAKHIITALENVSLNTDDLLKEKLREELGDVYGDRVMTIRNEVLLDIEEHDLKDEKEAAEVKDDHELAVDIIRPDVLEEIKQIEEKAQAELQQMHREHQLSEERLRLFEEKRKEEDKKFDELMREKRQVKMKELDDLQVLFQEHNQVLNNTLQDTLDLEDRQMKIFEQDMEEKLDILNKDCIAEKERLITFRDEMAKITNDRLNGAATVIQKYFKRYRVQKLYASELKRIKEKVLLLQKEKINNIIKERERLKVQEERRHQEQLLKEENERIEKEREKREKDERKRLYEQQKTLVAQERVEQKENNTSCKVSDGETMNKLTLKCDSLNQKNNISNQVDSKVDLLQHEGYISNQKNSQGVSLDKESKIISNQEDYLSDALKQKDNICSEVDSQGDLFNQETNISNYRDTHMDCAGQECNISDQGNSQSDLLNKKNDISHQLDSQDDLLKKKNNVSHQPYSPGNLLNKKNYIPDQPDSQGDVLNMKNDISHQLDSQGDLLNKKSNISDQPDSQVDSLNIRNNTSNQADFHLHNDNNLNSLLKKEKVSSDGGGGSFDDHQNGTNNYNSNERKTEKTNENANVTMGDGIQDKISDINVCNIVRNLSDITDTNDPPIACEKNIQTENKKEKSVSLSSTKFETGKCNLSSPCQHMNTEENSYVAVRNGAIDLSASIENAKYSATTSNLDMNLGESNGSFGETSCSCFDLHSPDEASSCLLQLYQHWLSQSQLEMSPMPIKMKSKSKRRFVGRGNSSPLTQQQILDGCIGSGELDTVKVVALQNIKENVSCAPLSQCQKLECLSLEKCKVETLDGIDSCALMKSLSIQHSNVTNMDLKLVNLCVLNLSNNNLSTIHGFDELPSLLSVNLSHNSITRITGLEQCSKLLHLNVDSNQILSTRGTENLSNLIYFSCANNDISSFGEVKKLPFLQILNLSGNTLTKVPCLVNNVLLRELYLDSNNISTIDDISSYWLPLLRVVSVVGNCLQEIPDIGNLISLQHVKLENNLVSNMNALQTLRSCHNLRILSIHGNSVSSVENYRFHLKKLIPQLRKIDDEDVGTGEVEESKCICLKGLCLSQNARFEEIMRQIDMNLRYTSEESEESILEKLQMQCNCWEKLHRESIRQLDEYKHICNDQTVLNKEGTQFSEKGEYDLTVQKLFDTSDKLLNNDSILPVQLDGVDQRISTDQGDTYTNHEITCAIQIQSVYRGHRVRRAYHQLKGSCDQMSDDSNNSDYAYDEVNLDEFDLNDSMMEWNAPSKPQLPSRGPPLTEIPTAATDDKIQVKKAWCSPENRTPPHTTTEARSPSMCSTHPTEGNTSSCGDSGFSKKASKKTEKISDEWGFQNEATAELMLKRAKKLGKGKRKKVNSADRYQLFKRAEGSSQGAVSPRKKKVPERISYFQGDSSSLPPDEKQNVDSQKMTYKWVCNQPVLHSDRAADVMSRNADYFTEIDSPNMVKKQPSRHCSEPILLPHLDPAVIAGKPLALIQSEVHNPKPPFNSRSTSGSGKARKRLLALQTKAHSAPHPDKRTDLSLTITNEMGEKWKNCVYR